MLVISYIIIEAMVIFATHMGENNILNFIPVNIFCGAKVAGKGDIIVQQNFSAAWIYGNGE